MLKNRKNSSDQNKKSKRKRIVFSIYVLTFILALSFVPFMMHSSDLTRAQKAFNFEQVAEEITWINKHYPGANLLPNIRDAKLWYRLNQGIDSELREELKKYQGDKYRFWEFQLELKEGNLDKAKNIIDLISLDNLKNLAKGFLQTVQGNNQTAKVILESSQVDWESLNRAQKVLRLVALMHSNFGLGNYKEAQENFIKAEGLEPNNPLVLSTGYYLSVLTKNWVEAERLYKLISPKYFNDNVLFITTQGLVAIERNNKDLLAENINKLEKLNQKGYVSYLKGLESLSKNEFKKGLDRLNFAIENGVDGLILKDAVQAKKQVEDRIYAENALQPIIKGGGH